MKNFTKDCVMCGNDKKPLGIYVHIPFCVKKCLYCDFVSVPRVSRDDGSFNGLSDSYVGALLIEIDNYREKYRCRDTEYEVKTVYIGGGTPSVLAPVCIVKILEQIKESFVIDEDAEITIEVNPGTVDINKLKAYREAGINRLSIGLQSANDNELKALGRIHDTDDFVKAYEEAVAAGFDNINVDIMTAIPYQTMDSLGNTLDTVTGLKQKPYHISAYSLIIEEGTPFYEIFEKKTNPEGPVSCREPSPCLHVRDGARKNVPVLPDEETERAMYHFTVDYLKKHGYERYEISNFAKPGHESRHNTAYWKRRDYIGFGTAASSLVNDIRYKNTVNIETYIPDPLTRDSLEEEILLSREDEMSEFMFLGLRMSEGVKEEDFKREFMTGIMDVYGAEIKHLIKDGLLAYEEAADRYYLTEEGIDYGNYVFSRFV